MTVLILMLLAAGDAVVISEILCPRHGVGCCYRQGLNLLAFTIHSRLQSLHHHCCCYQTWTFVSMETGSAQDAPSVTLKSSALFQWRLVGLFHSSKVAFIRLPIKMLDSVSHNPSVLHVFWVSESQRCTSWGLIPVSPEAPLISWHWRPEVMMEVGVPLTDHLIRLQFTLQVPWVTWPAVTRPPLPVMWHSPPLEETVVGRTRCRWQRCPSLEGVNEAKGVSWVLFLVVFLGPLQGAHRLLHTVVQDVLHLRRRRRRRTFSQLHLFHNNDKVTFYFRTVGLQQGKMSSESWGLLQYGPDTA